MAEIIVLFEVTLKTGKTEEYLKQAEALKQFLEQAEGLIRAERFSSLVWENKLLSLSVWDREESISIWRNQLDHRLAQENGRINIFEHYQITVVQSLRRYTMAEREEAPVDSNGYFQERNNHLQPKQ